MTTSTNQIGKARQRTSDREHKSSLSIKKIVLAIALLLATPLSAVAQAPDRIRQYTYDADGNITQIDTDVYVYDSVDRVISGTVSGRIRQYTYDAFGNRRKCKGIYENVESDCQYSAQITSSSNHVTGAVYDGPGNLQSYAGQTYTYDDVGSTTSNGTVEYVYTADDERIAIINGVQWKWTLRDGADKVLREVTSIATMDGTHSNWQWTRDNVFRNGTLLSSVDPNGTRNYHTDHLGTPRVVSDTTGAIVGIHDYFAFGLEVGGNLTESNPGRLKFTGHERDEDGLDYMHARYYEARWGRFLTMDRGRDWAATQPQSWNLYSYTRNNPINRTDPTGLWTFSFGFSFEGTTIGWHGSTKYAIAVDDEGTVAIVRSRAAGGGAIAEIADLDASMSIELSPTNDTVADMNGSNLVVGGGGGVLGHFGAEAGFDNEGPTSISLSYGLGIGGEGHAVAEKSEVLLTAKDLDGVGKSAMSMLGAAILSAIEMTASKPDAANQDRDDNKPEEFRYIPSEPIKRD